VTYVVLDLEWNRPEGRNRIIRTPFPLYGEIVQIGAVKLNEKFEEIDRLNLIVKPVYYPKMNRDIADLTGITDEITEKGLLFADAVSEFEKWCGTDSSLLTWGPDDMEMLEDNLEIHGMDTKWLPECFDVQLMFDDLVIMEDRQFSLDYAVYYFGIKGNTAHDALNDALDTAEVIRKMYEAAEWIDEERKYREEEN